MFTISNAATITNSVGETVKELKSGEVHQIKLRTSPTYNIQNSIVKLVDPVTESRPMLLTT